MSDPTMVLSQVASQLVRRAKTGGAVAAEVLLEQRGVLTMRSMGAGVGGGQKDTRTVVVTAYGEKGRTSSFRGPVQEWASAGMVCDEAIAGLADAKPDPTSAPPERHDVASIGLGLFDPRQAALTDADRKEVLVWNEDAGRRVNTGLRSGALTYREAIIDRAYASSRGVELQNKSTRFDLLGSVYVAADPSKVLHGTISSRVFADVASMPLSAALAQRLAEMTDSVDLPDAPCNVVLEPRVVSAILRGLAPAFSEVAVERGDSFLAGKMGHKIGSDHVYIIDDAALTGGLLSRAFDDRGVPPMAIPLVREGVADRLYRDPATAMRTDTRSTGHQGPDGSLWHGNLIVRPGRRTRNMLFPDLGTHVRIDDVLDTSGINPVTGAIEVPVHAFVENTEKRSHYAGTPTFKTTALELLSSVVELASDHVRENGVDSPTWVLDGPWFKT